MPKRNYCPVCSKKLVQITGYYNESDFLTFACPDKKDFPHGTFNFSGKEYSIAYHYAQYRANNRDNKDSWKTVDAWFLESNANDNIRYTDSRPAHKRRYNKRNELIKFLSNRREIKIEVNYLDVKNINSLEKLNKFFEDYKILE